MKLTNLLSAGKALSTFMLALGLTATAHASDAFPSRPVKIVVGTAAGSATDVLARRLAAELSKRWGQGVVIDNLLGAGGRIAASTVARAQPDGYTLMMVVGNYAIGHTLFKNQNFNILEDFDQIARVGTTQLVFIANPSTGISSMKDLVEKAKAQPKVINYGSSGVGSITHLSVEMLMAQANIQMLHVPFRGIDQMVHGVVGNQVTVGTPSMQSAAALITQQRLKALAVTGSKRSTVMPNVPTVEEAGYGPYEASAWHGIQAPKGTPKAVIDKIRDDVLRIAAQPDFWKPLEALGIEPAVMGSDEFKRFLKQDIDRWAAIIKAGDIKVE